MHACAAAGAGFQVAVLWFDLMFDVQVRRHAGPVLPADTLASIAAYYRRVTTQASPMGRLITVVMALTVLCIAVQIARRSAPWWIAWPSLAAALTGIGLAVARTVRNAVRLGRAADDPETQTRLARSIWRDHLICLAAMTTVLTLQLAAGV
ncbi:MAG TPA: hypothetical protein VKU90_08405 [Caulobacteraceae bacterium]|nr:hypothetical protein [Caulobacteraceae bacterium]